MMSSIINFIMSDNSIRHGRFLPDDGYVEERRKCCDDHWTRSWRGIIISCALIEQVMHLLASAVCATIMSLYGPTSPCIFTTAT